MDMKYTPEAVKKAVIEYFSEELQNDETPRGAQRRNDLKKQVLSWATGKHMVRNIMSGEMVEESIYIPYGCSVQDEAYWCN